MLNGGWLYFYVVVLGLWLGFLSRTCWRLLRKTPADRKQSIRGRLTIIGMALSALAVGSLLLLHLSWISAGVSQYLGVVAVRILSLFFFWPALGGLVLCSAGSGRIRFLGIGTSLIMGLYWLGLVMQSAISMGAVTIRHPIRFLIPDGYVGWVEVRYGQTNANALPINNGTFVCRIADSGLLETSSPLEAGWALKHIFFGQVA